MKQLSHRQSTTNTKLIFNESIPRDAFEAIAQAEAAQEAEAAAALAARERADLATRIGAEDDFFAAEAGNAEALDQGYAQLVGDGSVDIDFQGLNLRNNRAERAFTGQVEKIREAKIRSLDPALLGTGIDVMWAEAVDAGIDATIGAHGTELQTSDLSWWNGLQNAQALWNSTDGVEIETDGPQILASLEEINFNDFALLAMANDEFSPDQMLAAVHHLSGDARTDAERIIANRIMRAEEGTDLNFTRQWAQALEATGHPSAVAVAAAETQLTSDIRSAEYAAARAEDTTGIKAARAQLAARQAEAEVALEAFGGRGDEELVVSDLAYATAEAGTQDISTLDLALSGKTLDLSAPLRVDPDMVTTVLNVRQEGETNAAFTLTPNSNLTFNGGEAQTGRELGFASNVHEMQFVSVIDESGRTGWVAADYLIN